MKQIDRMPKKKEIIIYNTGKDDKENIEYEVLGLFNNSKNILNIKEVNSSQEHTQIIAKFKDGFNKFLYFKN